MGDIHGHVLALDQCLERCEFNASTDLLIQLGDVSDRGPDTAWVVERLLNIPHLIAIRGNHDEWTMDWMVKGVLHPAWVENGGQETLESYQRMTNVDLEKHRRFFSDIQQDHYIDAQNNLFTHGGFVSEKGPAYDHPPTTCRWDRSLWNKALSGKASQVRPKVLTSFREIYIGHTPTLNWHTTEPMNACNVWNLDTGAGTTGKLTIMDMNTKEYWQSDPVSGFYEQKKSSN
ncbi:MAG: metallophosphoesterase [Bacteroidota bacterium]